MVLYSSWTCFNTKQIMKIYNITFVPSQEFDGIFPYFEVSTNIDWAFTLQLSL